MFNKRVTFSYISIIILLLIGGTLFLTIVYFNVDPMKNMQLSAILSGLVTGLVIMVIGLFVEYSQFKEIEKIRSLGIEAIHNTREGKNVYSKLINDAKDRIFLMGNTAELFMEDFGRTDREDSNALLNALNKNVKVKILVVNESFLEEKEKSKAENAKKYFNKINNPNFEVRYYNHVPTHSILIVGKRSLIGPYFPNVKSKDTPCIQMLSDGPFAKKYEEYFQTEWDKAIC